MAVSKLLPIGGANDFNLNLGGTYTSVTLNKEYSSGSYSITSGNNDTTLDIYAYNTDGSLAGYTNTKSFTATKGFNKIVIIGGQSSDVLSFTYKTTYTTTDETAEITAGPVATSVSPSALPNQNDTFTLTGRNFATNATVTFTSANTAYTATSAKAITRNSATSLTVTRPDNLIQDYSPYTITVENPGVSNPTGSNSHILVNAITAGSDPTWVTGSTLNFVTGTAFSQVLSATDPDGGTVAITLLSGTLPTGLTYNSGTKTISGTPTSTSSVTVTFRATDSGNNTTDKAILFNGNPVWTTTGTISSYIPSAYSYQLVASDDSGALTYTLESGTLPTGLSLSSAGLISGSAYNGTTVGTATVTFRATDTYGNYTVSSNISIPYSFFGVGTSFTFTTAGQTGRTGPSLATCQSAYSATAWTASTSNLNMTTNGVQRWTVPSTGTYSFTVAGARGGSDGAATQGYGRIVTGNVNLTAGEVLNIVCGQPGADTGDTNGGGGGGGGTFVYTGSSTSYASTDLIFAAGAGSGGNRGSGTAYAGQHGLNSNSSSGGVNGYSGAANYIDGIQYSLGYGGGRASDNNYGASGGAGFLGDGANGYGNYGYPTSGAGGWIGGPSFNGVTGVGGFGGGGGATQDCGGSGSGAGYTGGGGASCYTVSGAGGSNYGTRVTSGTFGSTNNGSGYVTVTRTA